MEITVPIVHWLTNNPEYSFMRNETVGEKQNLVEQSNYCRMFIQVLLGKIFLNTWDLPLLLVGCYFNPLFNKINFTLYNNLAFEYYYRTQDFARAQLFSSEPEIVRIDKTVACQANKEINSLDLPQFSVQEPMNLPCFGSRKNLLDVLVSAFSVQQTLSCWMKGQCTT